MFEIVTKQILAENIKRVDIHAPQIARKAQAGQFVSVSPEEGDERIPLSIIDCDSNKGMISLIFREVGETTGRLGSLPIGESVYSILGPLGKPAKISKKGIVVCVATGIGTAQILPICRAFKRAGNKVIGVIGAKNKKSLLLEPQIRIACEKILIATEDGSYENKGTATVTLQNLIEKDKVNLVYAIGSVEMLQAVSQATKKKNIKTMVHLNPMMVDCVGMCGSCRVKVGGKMVLACIDGPEFNGHKVDFNDYLIRKRAYEEIPEWQHQKLPLSLKRKESRTLTRFLSGILKN